MAEQNAQQRNLSQTNFQRAAKGVQAVVRQTVRFEQLAGKFIYFL